VLSSKFNKQTAIFTKLSGHNFSNQHGELIPDLSKRSIIYSKINYLLTVTFVTSAAIKT